jgi:hypothetical protein
VDSLNSRSFEINCGNKTGGFHLEKVVKWSFKKMPIQKADLLRAIDGEIQETKKRKLKRRKRL